MHAYVDHNFLLNCMKDRTWRDTVIKAHQSRSVIVVLSPYHFYELGNARHYEDTEDLIKFTEELQPDWTMIRGDLQLFEFWAVWRQLWESSTEVVQPIGTLQEIAAVLGKVHYSRTAHVTIRDYVTTFSADGALDPIRAGMDEQATIAEDNQHAYVQGRFDKRSRFEMDRKHLALQLARLEIGDKDTDKVFERAKGLLVQQPISTQFSCFIDWGFGRLLKSYQTEGAFSEDLYFTQGKLSRNRFIDREHASVAIPHCEFFITSDKKLINGCNRVKARLPFPTAQVLTGEDFISFCARK